MKYGITLSVVALWVICAPASGQLVYRCGNAYSNQPCPGATTFDAADTRTSEQKSDRDAATAHAAKSATALEKERLAMEKSLSAKLSKSAARTTAVARTAPPVRKPIVSARQKKHEPEFFTAAMKPDTQDQKAPKVAVDQPLIAKTAKTVKP